VLGHFLAADQFRSQETCFTADMLTFPRLIAPCLLPAALAACMLGGWPAGAQTRNVGRWIVHSETNVVALTNNILGDGFAVRCLEGNLTLAVSEARASYKEGDVLEITWLVDRKPIIQAKGITVSDGLVEIIDQVVELVEQLPGSRELKVKISSAGTARNLMFSLADVTKAIAPALKECPLAHARELAREDNGDS
jgi:hypothetical protein